MDNFELLNQKLNSTTNYDFVLNKLCFGDESIKRTVYGNKNYVPFYFHLGTIFKYESVCEIGLNLGLFSGAYCYGCKKVNNFLAFNNKTKSNENISTIIPINNVKKYCKGNFEYYYGKFNDLKFNEILLRNKFGLIIINLKASYDEYRFIFDKCWEQLEDQGMMVFEGVDDKEILNKALDHFSKFVSKDILKFDTKFGTAILIKN